MWDPVISESSKKGNLAKPNQGECKDQDAWDPMPPKLSPMVVESEGFKTLPEHSLSQQTAACTLPSSIYLVNTLIKCLWESSDEGRR